MINAIFYKEFIKTYKVILLFFVIITYILFQTFLDAKNTMEFMDATSAILGIAQMGRFDFNHLEYACFFLSISFGIAQFYPEITQARIRLYLHLPLSHTKLVSLILFCGVFVLSLFFLGIICIYYFILSSYYPIEIFQAILTKLTPLFLVSILCYFAVVLGFLEPNIKKKIIYVSIAFFWANILFNAATNGYFASYLINFVLLGFIFVYIISAYEVFTAYTKGYIK